MFKGSDSDAEGVMAARCGGGLASLDNWSKRLKQQRRGRSRAGKTRPKPAGSIVLDRPIS
jgi:hypothetical protein